MHRMKGKAVLVTGAGSGIGRGIAKRLADEGAAVAVTDVNLAAAVSVSDAINDAGQRAFAAALDVRDESMWSEVAAAVGHHFGRWDGLVNNAAIPGPVGPLVSTSTEGWRTLLDVVLTGAFFGIRLAFRSMQQGGSIVNISSLGGLIVAPGTAAYGSAKAAINHLTRYAAKEAAADARKIRVNCISPGVVDTEGLRSHLSGAPDADQALTALAAMVPLGIGSAVDIASAATFLMSDESRWITGANLVVDGGMM